MAYMYGLTKAYDINEARRRVKYFADQSERDLWMANAILKDEIDKCSYSGYTEASIDIDFYRYCGEWAAEATAADLVDMYRDAGYKVEITPLLCAYTGDKTAYRITVSWEEQE